MKTRQYCNILLSKFKIVKNGKFKQHLWPFAAVSNFMAFPGANLLLAAVYKGQA